ncbi:MAG: multicopper oxidase domain-containing protein [Methylocystis sp.]|uniref:multicopper oxidase domain-containing protein n=1 Tax=Methylocystis sp. TaxID=1911079 RepID=UPI003DA1D314
MNKHFLTGVVAYGFFLSLCSPGAAAPFRDPPVFRSVNGVLDIVMVARTKPVEAISFPAPNSNERIHPTGWVYEICYRLFDEQKLCPPGSLTSSEFGGIRLALDKGDLLKVRLVNKLPAQNPAKVSHFWNMSLPKTPDPAGVNLPLTPTNLHTHGLVVQARAPSRANPTWGDDIYVDLFNPENGRPIPQPHQHGIVVDVGALDYEIAIPRNEPSGADWFHPHVHGITADSLSSGLAGIISIGRASDYASLGWGGGFPESQVRHITLKDMQVLAGGAIQFQQGTVMTTLPVSNGEVLDDQQDPEFCTQQPGAGEVRPGFCPGTNNTSSGGNNYAGGRWYFPVSGTVYPTIGVDKPGGEIWSISNIGASATYKLQLKDNQGGYPILMQLISVDGVSVHVPKGTAAGDKIALGNSRFTIVPCPGVTPDGAGSDPTCVKDFVMMPGSRAQVWVTYRDKDGNVVAPPQGGKTATFQTVGITTGAPGVGDPWPAVDLASVSFGPRDTTNGLVSLILNGDALAANAPKGIFVEPVPYAKPAPVPPNCAALPEGYRRRIFFGLVDTSNSNIFGLGYDVVDDKGVVVPESSLPVTAFDLHTPFVCLPLGEGQKPVRETWELVNLATENHNFHIHQTKFRAVQATADASSPLAPKLNPTVGAGVMEDNVPLAIAVPKDATIAQQVMNNQNGYCTIAQWRNGDCRMTPQVVDIPFAELGEFVYHCHILEHEDSGMMAKIQVVPAPGKSSH